jgi:hypothetical protein
VTAENGSNAASVDRMTISQGDRHTADLAGIGQEPRASARPPADAAILIGRPAMPERSRQVRSPAPMEQGATLSAAPPAERGDVGPAARAQAVPAWLQILGAVIAPSTLLTALAFYFGWERENALFSYFDIGPSMLNLSTQDYLLRSADVLFIPVGALLSMSLLAMWGHALIHHHPHRHARLRRYGARVLVVLGAALFAVGAVHAWGGLPFPAPFLLPQLSPGVGVALVAYGVRLWRGRINGWSSIASGVLVAMLIVLSLFWAAAEYAVALGTGRAQQVAAGLLERPGVLVYSKERLHIEAQGVFETTIGDADAAYRYRYKGLRLLLRSGGNYILLPALWSRTDRSAVILPEMPSIRLQFTSGANP